MSKIRKVQKGKVNGILYYRYMLDLPITVLDELGWNDSTHVKIDIIKGSLLVKQQIK